MVSFIRKIFFKIYYDIILRLFFRGEKYAKTIAIKKAKHQGVEVGENCRFYSTNFPTESYLIEIGNHVTITAGVKFLTHDGGVWVLRGLKKKYENIDKFGSIKIGDNVFIGANTIILPGVEIGDNVIIAAGSVVTKSFEGNEVIGGVPAKHIKSLNEYIESNKENFVATKNLSFKEKKKYILNINDY